MKKSPLDKGIFVVPSRGVEPLFEAPQAPVLSIERRGQIKEQNALESYQF